MKEILKKVEKVVILTLFCSLHVLNAADAAGIYKKCAGCHGKDGKHKAFDRSAVIAGESKDALFKKLIFFQSTDSDKGTLSVMKRQLKNLTKEDMESLAEYISKL